MNDMHFANRRYWNQAAESWKKMRDQDGLWKRCADEPDLAFAGGALGLIRNAAGDLAGRNVCVVGSGDNYVAFALSGMQANVTSIDISEKQLQVASERAKQLELSINFVQADAADLNGVGDKQFDLVCSSNGFFVWIADLRSVFNEIYRVLRPGGHYVFYDVHPFQRPWRDQIKPIEVQKPYWETGPFEDEEDGTFEFNWTLADILNPLADSGLLLRQIIESPAEGSRFWQDHLYLPGIDESLLDYKENPRAALPVWLAVASQRPSF